MMRIVPCLLVYHMVFTSIALGAGLVRNPTGLMGYRWKMDQKSALEVLPLAFSCEQSEPLTLCRATLDKQPKNQTTIIPASGGKLVLQFTDGRLIGLVHRFVTPRPSEVVVMMHNLMGTATHQLNIPKALDVNKTLVYSWLKPKSIIEVEVSEASDAEIPNAIVVVRAWSRRQYLRYHHILPIRTF